MRSRRSRCDLEGSMQNLDWSPWLEINGMRRVILSLTLVFSFLPINVVGQVKTPDKFRGAESMDQNSIGDLKWFEVFKDPELQSLIKTAMVQNYDLRTASARINAARANLGLARSEQFPQIYGSADLTTTQNSKNGPLGGFNNGGGARSFGSFFLNLL